jgi:hypothetical protein
MIFIYCNCVSSRGQRSVNWYKNGKAIAICTKGDTTHKTIQKHRIHKIENIEKRKKNIKNIKNINRVISK